MPRAADGGSVAPQHDRCHFHFCSDRGMSNHLGSYLSSLMRTGVQRNVRRYRTALPKGNWKLLRRPAEIFMVRQLNIFTPQRELIVVMTGSPFWVRLCASPR
jgi:hypothetical protein